MKIKLIKSAVGAYKLAYVAGEEIEVSDSLAEDMVQNGFAEYIENIEQVETKELKSTPEKAVKKSK